MTRDQAEAIARATAQARGWTWLEPVQVRSARTWGFGPRRWHVCSNSASKGINVRVEIDDRSEKVLDARFNPR